MLILWRCPYPCQWRCRMAAEGDAEVAGGIDGGAGTAAIMDNVPDGGCRRLFEGRGIEVAEMPQGQLSAVVAIDADQAQAAYVKIVFAREVTVELFRGLQRPGAVAEETLAVHIDSPAAPVRRRQCAVAADAGAGRGCGVIGCRAGFGVVCR